MRFFLSTHRIAAALWPPMLLATHLRSVERLLSSTVQVHSHEHLDAYTYASDPPCAIIFCVVQAQQEQLLLSVGAVDVSMIAFRQRSIELDGDGLAVCLIHV
jgi:hypothetical protein